MMMLHSVDCGQETDLLTRGGVWLLLVIAMLAERGLDGSGALAGLAVVSIFGFRATHKRPARPMFALLVGGWVRWLVGGGG